MMRVVVVSWVMVVRQILKDGMLLAVCFASILAGVFFRFAIPNLETLLCSFFAVSSILQPYYRLFDLLLMILTPYMICFASAMVMLDEHEQQLTRYLSVTPLQTRGYLVSRLAIPAVTAGFISLGVLKLFHLTTWTVGQQVAMSVLCSLTAIIAGSVIFSLSRNKIEGMAMGKLSSLLLLGLPIPFLFHDNFQYLFSFLPSYWMARFALEGSPMFFLFSLILSLATIPYFYARVLRKII
jgi:fluoroquinolone transport system permease protein